MDIFDVNASRCAGSLTVDSSAILEGWLHSNYSYTVLPCVDGPMRSALMATGASVGFHMPKVDTETENLVVAGSYAAARTVGAVLIDGKLKVSFDVIDVSFQPQWANPTWSLLGFSQELEQPQILEAIKLVVTSLPSHSIQWEAASDTQFQWDTWLLVQGRLARGARWWGVQLIMVASLFGIVDLRGFGTATVIFWFAVHFRHQLIAQLTAFLWEALVNGRRQCEKVTN